MKPTHRIMCPDCGKQKMTAAAMNAAHILRGKYGMQLLMAVDKRKKEKEEKHGFPLQLPEQNKED